MRIEDEFERVLNEGLESMNLNEKVTLAFHSLKRNDIKALEKISESTEEVYFRDTELSQKAEKIAQLARIIHLCLREHQARFDSIHGLFTTSNEEEKFIEKVNSEVTKDCSEKFDPSLSLIDQLLLQVENLADAANLVADEYVSEEEFRAERVLAPLIINLVSQLQFQAVQSYSLYEAGREFFEHELSEDIDLIFTAVEWGKPDSVDRLIADSLEVTGTVGKELGSFEIEDELEIDINPLNFDSTDDLTTNWKVEELTEIKRKQLSGTWDEI